MESVTVKAFFILTVAIMMEIVTKANLPMATTMDMVRIIIQMDVPMRDTGKTISRMDTEKKLLPMVNAMKAII